MALTNSKKQLQSAFPPLHGQSLPFPRDKALSSLSGRDEDISKRRDEREGQGDNNFHPALSREEMLVRVLAPHERFYPNISPAPVIEFNFDLGAFF